MSLDTTKNIYIYLGIFFRSNYVSTSYYYYYFYSVSVRFRMDTKLLFASLSKKKKKIYPMHNQGYREIIWRER